MWCVYVWRDDGRWAAECVSFFFSVSGRCHEEAREPLLFPAVKPCCATIQNTKHSDSRTITGTVNKFVVRRRYAKMLSYKIVS